MVIGQDNHCCFKLFWAAIKPEGQIRNTQLCPLVYFACLQNSTEEITSVSPCKSKTHTTSIWDIDTTIKFLKLNLA